MTRKTKLILGAVVLVVLALIITSIMGGDNQEVADNGNQADKTIFFGTAGFRPMEVTVQAGDEVEFVNQTATPVSPASDAHPAHLLNTELNVGIIEPGESKRIVLTNEGTFQYHNDNGLELTGQITVQPRQ